MARVLVTGAADGLGLVAAQQLIAGGHEVVVHARSEARAREALASSPGAVSGVAGDLASLAATRALADRVNAGGRLDAVIHNAGTGYGDRDRTVTDDGLARVFQVNALAPYVLTGLIELPDRLVYLSSGLHRGGSANLDDLQWERRHWDGFQAYSDSKLFDAMLAAAASRRWPDVIAASVNPGWVPTRMGGAGAPDDLDLGADTQVWIASGAAPRDQVDGRHLFHRAPTTTNPAVGDVALQDALLAACEAISGVTWPRGAG